MAKRPVGSMGYDLRSASIPRNVSRTGAPLASPKQSHAIHAGRRERHAKCPKPTIRDPWLAWSLKKNGIPVGGLSNAPPPGCQKFTSSQTDLARRNEYQPKSVRAM